MNNVSQLKLLSLNVRGLHDNKKRCNVFKWLNENNCDIAFLQETFCNDKFIPHFNSKWKGHVEHGQNDSVHGRGVCILFNENMM